MSKVGFNLLSGCTTISFGTDLQNFEDDFSTYIDLHFELLKKN